LGGTIAIITETKHTNPIRKARGKKKNTKHHKTTTHGSEPTNLIKKNTNLNPQIYPIKKQREKNIAPLKHKPQHNHKGAKIKFEHRV
jgi:hypothetical protein